MSIGQPPSNSYRTLCRFCMAVGAIILLVGVIEVSIIGGTQVITWLQEGVWHPLRIADGLQYAGIAPPAPRWVGVQHIVAWCLDQTLAGGLFLLSVLVSGVFVIIGGVAEAEALKLERAWRDDAWARQVSARSNPTLNDLSR